MAGTQSPAQPAAAGGPDGSDGRLSAFDLLGQDAARLDAEHRFPLEAVALFARTGLLAAPLPQALGGCGLGVEPQAAAALAGTLYELGRAWLPLARVYEGHVNALRLIVRYGTASQAAAAAADAHAGALFAIWAAEAEPVEFVQGSLRGRKSFASGAGSVTRPLVTARRDGAEILVLLRSGGTVLERVAMSGMAGAGTAAVALDDLSGEIIGAPGDYMRQPEISLGAWRALPGLLGGIEALVAATAHVLRARGRDQDPIQKSRFGAMLVAERGARLWVDHAAMAAEAADAGEEAAATVKLARHAIDQAVTLVLDHARRAAGLSAFVRGSTIERLARDLDTYRRQPALDEVLLEAAEHALARG